MHEGRASITVAPHGVARLVRRLGSVPVGSRGWRGSRVLVPPELAELRWRCVFTGEQVRTFEQSNRRWFLIADLFRACPVALLSSEP
jgi:maltooligosyltrehalose synthase